MSELGEVFDAWNNNAREHRRKMLALADTTGWHKFTDYHFCRFFAGERMDWWPSGGKARYKGKMIYGHRKVNALIAKLKSS